MTWQERIRPIEVGDKVAYSASFLRSIAAHAGEMPHARGFVQELQTIGETTLALIDWNNDEIPPKVNVANLARVGGRGFALD